MTAFDALEPLASDSIVALVAEDDDNDAVAFLCTAARLLHDHGAPVSRVEDSIVACGDALGLEVQVFATPTSVELAFGGRQQRGHLIRGESGDVELARLVALDRVIAEVRGGGLGPAKGRERLLAAAEAAPAWGPRGTVVAYALTSAASAHFCGGAALDLLVTMVIGLGIGLLSVAAGSRPGLGQLFTPIAAFAAALSSTLFAACVPGLQDHVTTLASLIVLLPGLSLTLALTELATRHLVSGTARLAGAIATFVTMAFGVGVARAFATHLDAGLDAGLSLDVQLAVDSAWLEPAPALVGWAALVIAPIGWAVVSQARAVDLPAIVLTGVVSNELTRLVGMNFGLELGAFAGALAVGLAANAYARWRALPPSVILQPCLLILVPGSVGFRGVTLFLSHDALAGVEAGFHMILVAASLVAGVLAANIRLRRTLEVAPA